MEKEEFNKHFGAFIQKIRKEKGWSQPALADKMGNKRQNISRVEKGETSPTLYWISHLARVFEMELEEFIDEFSKTQK